MTSSDPRRAPRPSPRTLDRTFDAEGLATTRALLAGYAREVGAHGEDLENLLITAAELTANAVRHGGGAGRLRAWRAADGLYCQVTDRGPGIDDPEAGTRPPVLDTVGGRGLWIARRLSDHLVITNLGRGVRVTAVIRLGPGDGHPEGSGPRATRFARRRAHQHRAGGHTARVARRTTGGEVRHRQGGVDTPPSGDRSRGGRPADAPATATAAGRVGIRHRTG